MKNGEFFDIKFLFAITIPFLLMAYVQTHSFFLLILAFGLVVVNIANPFVLLPSAFVTSLSTEYFKTTGGASLTPMFQLILIVSFLLSTKPDEYRRSGKTLVYVLVFICYNFLSSAFSVTGSFETFFLTLFYFGILFFMYIKRNVDVGFVYRTLSVSCLLFSFFLLFSFLTGGMEMAVGNDSENRLTFGDINANRYGMLCTVVASVLIYSFFYEKNFSYKLTCLSGLFITIFIIILTGSRTALFAVVGGFFFALLFFVFRNKKDKGKYAVAMMIVLLVFIMIGLDYLTKANLPILERFELQSVIESGGTGRTDRMGYLFTRVFPNNYLWGIGLGGENEYAVSEGPCHNIIFDPLIQIGVFGFLLYWSLLLPLIIKCYKSVRNNPINFFPFLLFVTVLINGIGEVIFFERHFWLIISLCALYTNNGTHIVKSLRSKYVSVKN